MAVPLVPAAVGAVRTVTQVAATSAGRAAISAVAAKALSQDEQDKEAEKEMSTNVSSSVIASISWKDEVITVNFHRGGTHTYPGSREVYEDFVSAPSVGKYFNQYIR